LPKPDEEDQTPVTATRFYEDQNLDQMLELFRIDYLTKTGWLRSAELKEAVNNEGPVPWMTYPAIKALERLVRSDMQVFEFGSGASTLWWGQRCASVVAVEHDVEWAAETAKKIRSSDRILVLPAGSPASRDAALKLEPLITRLQRYRRGISEGIGGFQEEGYLAYVSALLEFPRGTFQIISVDGQARNLAASVAAEMVHSEGCVIVDNSDLEQYAPAFNALQENGFARIDFWGPGPINPYEWCTSIFTKSLALFNS
jgi:hypothetical protein